MIKKFELAPTKSNGICLIFIIGCLFFMNFSIKAQNIILVIHGGAGTITKENMTDSLEHSIHDKLAEALNSGYKILTHKGASIEAIKCAINILEDSPLFNAGKGAVFDSEGKNEMDASIMDGKTLNAGAVAGVTNIKNPINAAIAVMNNSPHVMLSGKGAEEFAREEGLEIVDPSYFFTPHRYEQWKNVQEAEKKKGPQGYYYLPETREEENHKYGTVGAVALDMYGNLAAGTSTGGITNKRFGRIGDSPVIGAGTYASNETCAVSATGDGEYFIRTVAAYSVSALMTYKNIPIEEAAKQVIFDQVQKLGGHGGVIALDAKGNFAMVFNTSGMYRGYLKEENRPQIFIYK